MCGERPGPANADDRDDTEHIADVHDIAAARAARPDWSDDYLEEQLSGHDESPDHVPPAPTPMSRVRHGGLGMTLGAAMTGLGNVLEPRKKEETAVVFEHDEPDHSRDPVELRLDRDDPG